MAAAAILVSSSPVRAILTPARPAATTQPSISPHFASATPSNALPQFNLTSNEIQRQRRPELGHTQGVGQLSGEEIAHMQTNSKAASRRRPVVLRPIPKSAEYILDSDDSDEPLAQVMSKSKYFSEPSTVEDAAISGNNKASRRRRSWTPIEGDARDTMDTGFANLCKTFNYGDQVLSTAPPKNLSKRQRAQGGDTTPKLKRAAVAKNSGPKPPARLKKPAKRPRTITALATAAYQTIPDVTATIGSITEQPAPPSGRAMAMEDPLAMPPPQNKGSRKTSSATRKVTSKTKKASISTQKAPERMYEPLLEPSQAQRKLSNQTFVFGSSSQLQIDAPSEVLQDLQQALMISEELPSSPVFLDSPERASNTAVPTAPHGTTLSTVQAEQHLWRAAARNMKDGMYKHVGTHSGQDMIDAAVSVVPGVAVLELSSDEPLSTQVEACPLDRERSLAPVATASHEAQMQPTYMQPQSHRAALRPLDNNQRLRSLSPPATKLMARAISTRQTPVDALSTPRRRGRPPKATIPSPNPEADPSPRSSPPSRWYCVDEIMDSEESSPPSARRKAPSSIAPLKLTNEDGHEIEAAQLPLLHTHMDDPAWNATLDELFVKITETVRSTERSDSLDNPTWHEKMLLYDPIVIEDLTSWLNDRGLRVSLRAKQSAKKQKNGTVPALPAEIVEHELTHWMVQKWCRQHSICCLFREGLRGGVRTRY